MRRCVWPCHLFTGGPGSHTGPVWDHVGGERDPEVPITSEAPNNPIGLEPVSPLWWTIWTLYVMENPKPRSVSTLPLGSLIKLSTRLVTSNTTWHEHVYTPSIMFYISSVCVEDCIVVWYWRLPGYCLVLLLKIYVFGSPPCLEAMCMMAIPNENLVFHCTSRHL